jgi:prophage maintenance system killer protein
MDKLVDQLFELKQLAHENNFGALANDICGKLPQWTSALEKVPEKKWPADARQTCERKLGAVAQAKKTFNTLGNDKWREFIDGKDRDHGASCYDEGSNGGGKDPGWLASEKLADRHVGEHLGEHLDVGGYAQIHDLALQHGKARHGFRSETNDIGVPTKAAKRDMSAVAEMGPEPTVDISGKADEGGIYRATHTPMPRPEVQARVQEALDEYYFNIGRAQSKNDKLRVITQVHQKLERLHAFIDGTGRTDHFVLNKFLVENGFSPVILHDQNEVNHSTAATWQAAIEKGMDDWLAYANEEAHKQEREQYDAEMNKAVLVQMMMGGPDVHEGRALPQVSSDARQREEWRKSHSKVGSSPAQEEKKSVEEQKEVKEEKKENPLLALKHGKSELAQKVIDLAIEQGFKDGDDLARNSWWGDFKSLGVTEQSWEEIKAELGI